MQRILGIIPARYASTRLPGKPLADINGKPMIQWVYDRCKGAFNRLVVATDDYRIISAVHKFGGEAVLTAATHKSGTDRCIEAYSILMKEGEDPFDIVVNVQGDEPMVNLEQIHDLISCFKNDDVGIATLIQPLGEGEDPGDRNIVKAGINPEGRAMTFSRSPIPGSIDDADKGFYKHIGMYAYRPKVLGLIQELEQSEGEKAENLEQLRWLDHGFAIQTAFTKNQSIGVDSPSDLDIVRALLRGQ